MVCHIYRKLFKYSSCNLLQTMTENTNDKKKAFKPKNQTKFIILGTGIPIHK